MSTAIQRRSYTAEQKAEVLAVLRANAGNLRRTAITVGVPRKTIERWVQGQASDRENPEDTAALRQSKTSELGEQFRSLAVKMLGLLDGKLDTMSGRDLAIAAAIASDKFLLLTGGVTARTENVGRTKAENEARQKSSHERNTESTEEPSSLDPAAIEKARVLLARSMGCRDEEDAIGPPPEPALLTFVRSISAGRGPTPRTVITAHSPVPVKKPVVYIAGPPEN